MIHSLPGKWWGSKDIQPIVAIHGWLDNAGTWKPFAKELSPNFSLLAVDIPGHGLSSHLPPFQTYSFYSSAAVIRRIKKYFDFDNLSLLGHSGGSAMCFIYSSLYPEDVHSYFGIDYLLYAYKDELKRAEKVGKLIDKKILLSFRDPTKAKSYTEEEAIRTWVTATKGSLTESTAKILMERGVFKVANSKVAFSRDGRLKTPDLSSINVAQAHSLAENIKCNVCIVKAKESKLFDGGIKYCPDILNIIEKNAKSFYFHKLDGNHHLHMDIPEKVVEVYSDFINNTQN